MLQTNQKPTKLSKIWKSRICTQYTWSKPKKSSRKIIKYESLFTAFTFVSSWLTLPSDSRRQNVPEMFDFSTSHATTIHYVLCQWYTVADVYWIRFCVHYVPKLIRHRFSIDVYFFGVCACWSFLCSYSSSSGIHHFISNVRVFSLLVLVCVWFV